jgi:hypothetical protein
MKPTEGELAAARKVLDNWRERRTSADHAEALAADKLLADTWEDRKQQRIATAAKPAA